MPVSIQPVMKGRLACWQVRRGDSLLLVAEQGAQVLEYRQGDAAPVIWLSEQAAFDSGQPVRGGIPVCWPWFGDLARNPEAVQALHPLPAPAHGLVRGLPWTLERQAEEQGTAVLDFNCPPLAQRPGLQLRLQIRLDDALHLRLTSHNLGDATVTLSQALHSYLAVGDIHRVSVQGLDDTPYIETLEDWQPRRQSGELRFDGETDRIYLDLPQRLALIDPAWQRRIELHASGSRSAVLWNPWIDKSRRLSQFAEDAWQRMLCIETANVLDDVVRLAPGATHTLGLSIALKPSP
ncbi:D-hexose-6-phosphate mutarotase [Stutzerimonas kirkiae]|uniref:D-hexose-6-phosphate mutarotase n=1 Tax=Stutzerimonas kirkiae TaxID=2211392 RepID=UPI0010384231|nr:D-hexose-6-phosphate mutarotase [Stutzerimonas kirkiae]TBV08048.1 D-hexose-6-phosphate mutarotase [Stutzerimonas kirkiae]TBV15805.1 D-hexose-6-phosphate mutarotase [Stutzerimonas kirkiae]